MESIFDPKVEDDLGYRVGMDEQWLKSQAERRQHVRARLGLCGRFLRYIAAAIFVLIALLYFEVFPGWYGGLMLALGGFIAALAMDIFSIWHYRHVHTWR